MAWSREIEKFAREYYAKQTVDPDNRAADYYWQRKRRLVLDLIRSHFDQFGPSPFFVDLGCGEGYDLAPIATYVNRKTASFGEGRAWRFIGVEGFPASIAICRELLLEKKIPNVEIRVANIIKRLPLGDGEVDLLYCSEVLEHIPNVDPMLAEMHRVVRPGGYVLMTTPNQPNVFQRSFWNRERFRRQQAAMIRVCHHAVAIAGEEVDIYGHVSLHRNEEWDALFAQHGFRCIDFRRGAMTYGGHRFLSKSPFHQIRLAFENALDLLPRSLTRNLSDQVVALYRRDNS